MKQTMQPVRLTKESTQQLLETLPEFIKVAYLQRAADIEYPIEAVIEMALASYLDAEALSFEDCLLAERLDSVA